MKNFHDYYFSLSKDDRHKLATQVGTTIHNLEGIAGGFKVPSLPMAARLVKASSGGVSFDMLVKTAESKRGPF